MKLRTLGTVGVSLGIASVLGLSALPALATSPAPLPEPLTLSMPTTVQHGESLSDEAELERLRELAKTQTPEEVQAILDAGPSVSLSNESGEVVAAFAKDGIWFDPFLSAVAPGCAVGDACAWSGGGSSPNGFTGTGQLNYRMYNVTKISSGSYPTTFWSGSSGDYLNRNSSMHVPGRNYTSLTRG